MAGFSPSPVRTAAAPASPLRKERSTGIHDHRKHAAAGRLSRSGGVPSCLQHRLCKGGQALAWLSPGTPHPVHSSPLLTCIRLLPHGAVQVIGASPARVQPQHRTPCAQGSAPHPHTLAPPWSGTGRASSAAHPGGMGGFAAVLRGGLKGGKRKRSKDGSSSASGWWGWGCSSAAEAGGPGGEPWAASSARGRASLSRTGARRPGQVRSHRNMPQSSEYILVKCTLQHSAIEETHPQCCWGQTWPGTPHTGPEPPAVHGRCQGALQLVRRPGQQCLAWHPSERVQVETTKATRNRQLWPRCSSQMYRLAASTTCKRRIEKLNSLPT